MTVNWSEGVETLKAALAAFFSFKAYVMLPLVIFVLALIVRMKVGQAALSALKVAVGFAGIASIGPAVQSLIARRGLDYPVLDVGWPPLAAITWASKIAPLSIPLVLAINLGMLAAGVTRTLGLAFVIPGNPLRFWFFHLFQGNWIALLLLAPAAALLWLAWRRCRERQKAAG
jgi:galactitol-specific phosphotransferase system IIC component